jgi:hypothetical protein
MIHHASHTIGSLPRRHGLVTSLFQQQVRSATLEVLQGRDSSATALVTVQRNVLIEEQRRRAYGAWNWQSRSSAHDFRVRGRFAEYTMRVGNCCSGG